jgi:type I restriction enzyme S subunit
MSGSYDYYGASGVIDKVNDYLFDKPLLLIGEDGANLINRSTPIAFIAHGKYWVNNHAHVLDGINVDFLRYLELYINSIDLRPYITGTAQPKMNQAKMNDIEVWVPPAAEQLRILAKLEELLQFCDQLELKINQLNVMKRKIADVLVEQALA